MFDVGIPSRDTWDQIAQEVFSANVFLPLEQVEPLSGSYEALKTEGLMSQLIRNFDWSLTLSDRYRKSREVYYD